MINLQNNENEVEYSLEKIILFQLNKINDSSRTNLKDLKNRLKKENHFTEKEIRKKICIRKFLNLWKDCWNFKHLKDFILTYSQEQSLKKCEFIIDKLNEIKKSKIIPYKTLILFPENSIPYELINQLIDFADEKKIILVGGLEHKKVEDIRSEFTKLGDKYNDYCRDKIDYNNLPFYNNVVENSFINQAIIINANKYFSFQIKNIPVYNNLFKKKEGISTIIKPTFRKFKTTIGEIGVFICKDFLVNYSIIDKWMDRNKIQIIAIPSFSELVNPFLYKFGEIVSKPENRDKTFIFANITEYGGSGVYNFSNRRDYEPYKYKLFDKRKEGYEILNIK